MGADVGPHPWEPRILVMSEVSISPDTEASGTEAQGEALRRRGSSVVTACGIIVTPLP